MKLLLFRLFRVCVCFFICGLPRPKEISLKIGYLAMAATLVAASPAFASKDLAQKNACMACHAPDKKLVGPAYQDIAKKYAGQQDAETTLVKNIKAGGAGKWGPIPMPAQAALSEADAKTLAAWVLAGAK
jgi:cytochrome c